MLATWSQSIQQIALASFTIVRHIAERHIAPTDQLLRLKTKWRSMSWCHAAPHRRLVGQHTSLLWLPRWSAEWLLWAESVVGDAMCTSGSPLVRVGTDVSCNESLMVALPLSGKGAFSQAGCLLFLTCQCRHRCVSAPVVQCIADGCFGMLTNATTLLPVCFLVVVLQCRLFSRGVG